MTLAVWADAVDVPNRVCTNARLRGAATHPPNPDGQTHGQGGWDIGFQFTNLTDLAAKLYQLLVNLPPHMCVQPSGGCNGWWPKPCPPVGQVTRLAINAHGVSGKVYVGGSPSPDLGVDPIKEGLALKVENLANMAAELQKIHSATAAGSTIYLMGCLAGQTPDGTELLMELSKFWPQRRIVAFATVGYQRPDQMMREGERCTEPGMRDTLDTYPTPKGAVSPFGQRWNDLNLLPGLPRPHRAPRSLRTDNSSRATECEHSARRFSGEYAEPSALESFPSSLCREAVVM